MSQKDYTYDVFISYSHKDASFVRDWLYPNLINAGLSVCIDYSNFLPGTPSVRAIEKAILSSRKTMLILTGAYIQSTWCEFENIIIQTLDPSARNRRTIPVLLENCDLPLRISMLVYLDLRDSSDKDKKLQKLIKCLKE